jgi:hypothetical protein
MDTTHKYGYNNQFRNSSSRGDTTSLHILTDFSARGSSTKMQYDTHHKRFRPAFSGIQAGFTRQVSLLELAPWSWPPEYPEYRAVG